MNPLKNTEMLFPKDINGSINSINSLFFLLVQRRKPDGYPFKYFIWIKEFYFLAAIKSDSNQQFYETEARGDKCYLFLFCSS